MRACATESTTFTAGQSAVYLSLPDETSKANSVKGVAGEFARCILRKCTRTKPLTSSESGGNHGNPPGRTDGRTDGPLEGVKLGFKGMSLRRLGLAWGGRGLCYDLGILPRGVVFPRGVGKIG